MLLGFLVWGEQRSMEDIVDFLVWGEYEFIGYL